MNQLKVTQHETCLMGISIYTGIYIQVDKSVWNHSYWIIESLTFKAVWDGNACVFVHWKCPRSLLQVPTFLDSAELSDTLLSDGLFYSFPFSVVDKLKEMMEEIENAVNAFKEEQRQMYVCTRLSYTKRDIRHNENFALIK